QRASITLVESWSLDQALSNVCLKGRKSPDQERSGKVIQVGVHRLIREAQTLADLGRIPYLSVQRRQHPQQPIGRLWFRRQAPVRQVSLRQQCQIIELPSGLVPGLALA